jgi:hypothetical protein
MTEALLSSRPSEKTDQILADLVAEMIDRIHAGQSVDLTEYIARCPEKAEQIQGLLPALELLNGLASSVGSGKVASGRSGTTAEVLSGTLGDFRLLREVGRGGMGVVYEAEQISLRRRVALKVLPFAATMDPRHLQRFQNEARAAASLEHPHIVPVYGVGCERGVHFYAMKFIDGQTLAALIHQQRAHAASGGGVPPP